SGRAESLLDHPIGRPQASSHGTAFVPWALRRGVCAVGNPPDRVTQMKESADEELQRVKHRLAALEQLFDLYESTSLEQERRLQQLLQERSRTEEALAHERNLLRTLIDNIPDYIYVKDPEGRFLIANTALASRTGAARAEELLGRMDFDYYP